MVYNGILKGNYVELRSVTLQDAEFTLALRQNPELTKYLPYLNITLKQQEEWIKKQQKDPSDYFFVVLDKAGNRIGTQGVYHIHEDTAEGGRIAMISSDPFQIYEAALLLWDFVFFKLKINKTGGFIYADNKRSIRYHKMLGVRVSQPEKDKEGKMRCRFEHLKEDYEKAREKLLRVLYSE